MTWAGLAIRVPSSSVTVYPDPGCQSDCISTPPQ